MRAVNGCATFLLGYYVVEVAQHTGGQDEESQNPSDKDENPWQGRWPALSGSRLGRLASERFCLDWDCTCPLATAAVPTLMALGGCAALAAGTLQLRRRKERQIAVSRKRLMGLIATGGVFLTGGVLTMFEAAPFVSLLILAGAGCAGLGVIRIRMKRRYKQLRSAEKRIEVW